METFFHFLVLRFFRFSFFGFMLNLINHHVTKGGLLLVFASMIVSCDALRQCNNTTTFCADDEACCSALYSPTKFGCQLERRFSQNHDIRYGKIDDDSYPPSPTVSCCMPGPALEPSTEKKNCMILGDSVSIGYLLTDKISLSLEIIKSLKHTGTPVSRRTR